MPFDQGLATRLEYVVTECFSGIDGFCETRMMGGFGYMLHGHMCMGIHRDTLIVRVGVEAAQSLLEEPYVRPMDLTGKVMKGWATILPEAMVEDKALVRYCRMAVDFVLGLPEK